MIGTLEAIERYVLSNRERLRTDPVVRKRFETFYEILNTCLPLETTSPKAFAISFHNVDEAGDTIPPKLFAKREDAVTLLKSAMFKPLPNGAGIWHKVDDFGYTITAEVYELRIESVRERYEAVTSAICKKVESLKFAAPELHPQYLSDILEILQNNFAESIARAEASYVAMILKNVEARKGNDPEFADALAEEMRG